MAAHRLELAEARRIAVRAQLLDAPRPTHLLEVVERLTLLQLDPTAAVAPSADLVAWSRLGSDYRPADLQQALEIDRTLFEFNGVVRPMRDLGLYLADMATWPRHERSRSWLEANDRFRRDVLDLLGESGPLLSREIPDTSTVPWPSSGWTNDRNVTQMLEFLMLRGEVAISGRVGRQRTWDLAERVYPPGRRWCRPTRRSGSRRSDGSARWGSPAPRARPSRSTPTSWAMPASRRRSRASAAPGASIPSSSAGRSRAARRCCRRSTA